MLNYENKKKNINRTILEKFGSLEKNPHKWCLSSMVGITSTPTQHLMNNMTGEVDNRKREFTGDRNYRDGEVQGSLSNLICLVKFINDAFNVIIIFVSRNYRYFKGNDEFVSDIN